MEDLVSLCVFEDTWSKWMPWELGFMDGRKDRAAIIPVFENEYSSSHTFKGQEYLGVYPYCIMDVFKFNRNKEGLCIFEDENTYVAFDNWLKGEKPKIQY